MAEEKEKLRGKNLWDELEGKKEETKETVDIKFGDVEGEITVVFRDVDEVREVEQEYEKKLPPKKTHEFKGLGEIELPNDDYPQFNDHEKAVEWRKEAEPVRKEKNYRLAYLFIADDEKPHEDPEKGTEMLQDRLRYMDVIQIVNTGMRLAGASQQIEQARKNS